MNGVAVMLCVAALGVDHNWRTTPDGQLEYVLQVEPTFLSSLEQGEAVTSKLPPTAKNVHRLCLRVGTGDLRRVPQRSPEVPPLASAKERAVQGGVDLPIAIIVNGQGEPVESTDVSHGWQAVSREQVEYIVQLAPQLLSSLREGDEIYMNVYPEAGSIQQFTVLAGQNVLPRKAAHPRGVPAAQDHSLVAAAAAENPPAAAPEASPALNPRRAEPSHLRPSPPRLTVTDETAEQPAASDLYAPATEVEQPGQPATLFAAHAADAESTREPPARTTPNRSESPVFDHSQFDRGQFSAAPAGPTKFGGQAALAPPPDGNQYLPEEGAQPATKSRFGSSQLTDVSRVGAETEQTETENNRVASLDGKNGSSFTTASTKGAKKSTASAAGSEEPKPWWPLFFTCCALFLSVGGNFYLGWTAAEFYSRYRLAVERMRGSSRDPSEE